ncbi:cobalamin-independent methionine synthase II family protein [Pendulispora brunnea]|uniref:Cobalamin-independent methionine synthase II family protein n=1 Tax=Pendulispora brunnea TaxID=2905690 RepID=A0ABZ2JYM5_9BACT
MSQPLLFPTTVVGSMPRPLFVKELFDEFHEGKVSDAERQRLLDESVPLAIALQETAGVDIVSDGEWRRFSYVGVISDVASGFTRGLSGEKRDGKYWHTVTGEVTPGNADVLAEHARFAIAHSSRPVKVALPSPYLLSVRMWDETVSKNVYPTREDFARAIVPILRAQVTALADAGVHTVQLDDPHLCLFVDPEVRKTFADADREAMHCASLINDVFQGMNGIVRAVHLCRRNKGRQGWVGEGSYDRIMDPLRALDVDQLMMEFTIPAAGDMRCLRDLPAHFRIGLGCVDCRGEVIDSPETIVERVEKAMEHVAKERLVLAPDCGFAPGNAADIPLDEAYAKLRNMARAAHVLRERHG